LAIYGGIDGCKAGWFVVRIDDSDRSWSHGVFADIATAYEWLGASKILIDMQIGLVGDGAEGSEGRRCEREGRRLLGASRRSSIFVSPSRVALRVGDYPEASELNFRATGRRLSKQTWWIMPKILEVEEFVLANPSVVQRLLEVNMELLFWALNESRPMACYKKTEEGFRERMGVLESWYPRGGELLTDAMGSYLRRDVARDDIVDALAAAVSLVASGGQVREIPAERQIDSLGLPRPSCSSLEFWWGNSELSGDGIQK
jgi:predicted RNase H-like nuclease